MTTERAEKIALYGDAYRLLTEGLAAIPREAWDHRPADDEWTIHEILVHITDSEANSYVRLRRFLAEPGETLMAYDEMQWARALDYERQSTARALELFRWLRESSHELIRHLPDGVWASTAYHPENGTMTLDDWLDVYAAHVPEHLDQMRRVYGHWQEIQHPH